MGNLCYFALSATGVAALLLASAKLFKGLQIVGALYLLLLGFQMLRPDSGKTAAAEVIAPAGARAPFWRGLTVQLLNPKALIFFVSLLPQFVTTTAPVALQILVLGISSQLIEIATLAFYVAVAAQARNLGDERSARWLGRIGGALLIAIAARLLWRQ
jgi:threonine/homoserine/homoserine lactone efflux protein